MKQKLFIDTSAFIALVNPKDQFSQQIKNFLSNNKSGLQGVTTNLVLTEFLTYGIRKGIRNQIKKLHDDIIIPDSKITVVWIDQKYHRITRELMDDYDDKSFSFVDLSSFAVMRELAIAQAITFDDDFKKAGFEMLPHI